MSGDKRTLGIYTMQVVSRIPNANPVSSGIWTLIASRNTCFKLFLDMRSGQYYRRLFSTSGLLKIRSLYCISSYNFFAELHAIKSCPIVCL